MTRAELLAKVQALTGRPSGYSRLSDSTVYDYAFEGALCLAQNTLPASLLDEQSFSTSSGTSLYAKQCLRIIAVEIGGAMLTPLSMQRMFTTYPSRRSDTNATPTHWSPYGRDASGYPQFRLYPTPSATQTAYVHILKVPSALPSSGQILEWDEFECNALAYYAAWRHFQCKPEIDDGDFASKCWANYKRIEDMYRQINDVDSFFSQKAGVEGGWRGQGGQQQ